MIDYEYGVNPDIDIEEERKEAFRDVVKQVEEIQHQLIGIPDLLNGDPEDITILNLYGCNDRAHEIADSVKELLELIQVAKHRHRLLEIALLQSGTIKFRMPPKKGETDGK